MVEFIYSFVTTLPKEANAPSVTILNSNLVYDIEFYIIDGGRKLVKKCIGRDGVTVFANSQQWFGKWHIKINFLGELVSETILNLKDKVVFIKMDGYALGDNIAWIPYVEEFRIKHECTVICSTFYNDLFSKIYPEILFAPPNTKIDNVYSQYYIGASNDDDIKYSPINVDENPLQMVAPSILGIEYKEIRPQLEKQLKSLEYKKKYVCISECASHEKKMWKYTGGWQEVVDYLNSIDYDVVVISKEPTELKNIINLTGNHSILDRVQTLLDADFFIGVSSGLSWLSWAVKTYVFLISDVTQVNHEFQSGITRISANPDIECVNYESPNVTSPKTVINSIKQFINL